MTQQRIHVKGARVLVLGATFKENCPDIRNSKVFDVVRELQKYGAQVDVYDPWADGAECKHEYGMRPLRELVARPLRCGRAGRGARRVPQAGRGRRAPPVPQEPRALRHQARVPAPDESGRHGCEDSRHRRGRASSAFTPRCKLLERGEEVVGLDNLNEYYDVTLKQARLAQPAEEAELPLREARPRRRCADGASCSRARSSSA